MEHAPVTTDLVALDLPADHQNRRGSRIRGRDARRCVQQARTGHHQRRANLSAGAGVAVGHIGGSLLVADGDEPDARLVVQTVHHVVELDPRQSEYHPDAFPV